MQWYRTINPEQELLILAKRPKITDRDLINQPPYKTNKKHKDFTHLSAFQYLKAGIKQRISTKNEDDIGIILRSHSYIRTVFCRDSKKTKHSYNAFKNNHTEESFKKALEDKLIIQISETQVFARVQKLFRQSKLKSISKSNYT